MKFRYILSLGLVVVSCTTRKVTLDEVQYGQVTDPNGAQLHYKADLTSKVVKTLKPGTVIEVLRETEQKASFKGYGSAKLYKVKTRSGATGWTFGKFFNFAKKEVVQKALLDEMEQLSITIQQTVLDSLRQHVIEENRHPFTKNEATQILELKGTSTLGSLQITCTVFLKGSILGIDKYELTYDIFVETSDLDNLGLSSVKIINIVRASDIKTKNEAPQIHSRSLVPELTTIFGLEKFQVEVED